MTVARPAARPRLTRDQAVARMIAAGIDLAKHPLILIGIRAYYRDTQGKVGQNDRGIYDDAFALIGPGFSAPSTATRTRVATARAWAPGQGRAWPA